MTAFQGILRTEGTRDGRGLQQHLIPRSAAARSHDQAIIGISTWRGIYNHERRAGFGDEFIRAIDCNLGAVEAFASVDDFGEGL